MSGTGTPEIYLSVVKDHYLNESFLQQLRALPARQREEIRLPPETGQPEYFERLNAFSQEIRAGKLEKAILSRVCCVSRPDGFDAVHCTETLARDYPDAFVYFCLHPLSGIWMGASPELLLKKRGQTLYTMALAGTQARKTGTEYYWRTKEAEEHEMVGRHIEAVFKKNNCLMAVKKGPRTIESGRVAHLRTDYVFHEQSDISLRSLLSDLHPTPAIGGLPVKESVECILAHEGYDRKYYCGFIGETDFLQTADLYTNLRCMQIGEDSIAIYVGGGITAASDPEEEWDETVMKGKTLLEKIKPVRELY